MKLIREFTESVKYLIESPTSAGASKNYFIEGVFLQGEIKNRNGRVYPMDIMRKEVERYTKENIDFLKLILN
jgi:hypothetical protein